MTTIRFDRPKDAPLAALTAKVNDQSMVSLIMTCFNTAQWLERAVHSVLDQRGWERLELIVVNDGSMDDTACILTRLAKKDGRIRTFHLARNHGTYQAKNIGMSISRGELITFMDSDDTIHPDRIEQQARLLLDSGLIATTCNYVRVDPEDNIVPMGGLNERQALISLMFKRQVLADIGWFDSVRTSADDEFFERMRLVYGRNAHCNIPRAMYRALYRGESLSTGQDAPVVLSATDTTDMLSLPRRAYVESYRRWHDDLNSRGRRPYMPFNIATPRAFPIPRELALPRHCSLDH